MEREDLVTHCLTKPGAYLDSPWGEDHHVAKVGGKIFCFFGGPGLDAAISAKNTREGIQEWRARYPDHIGVAPYLNKELWNLVALTGSGAPDGDEARELIDDSYDLIVASLPRSKRP